jgi:hypothetical protein
MALIMAFVESPLDSCGTERQTVPGGKAALDTTDVSIVSMGCPHFGVRAGVAWGVACSDFSTSQPVTRTKKKRW